MTIFHRIFVSQKKQFKPNFKHAKSRVIKINKYKKSLTRFDRNKKISARVFTNFKNKAFQIRRKNKNKKKFVKDLSFRIFKKKTKKSLKKLERRNGFSKKKLRELKAASRRRIAKFRKLSLKPAKVFEKIKNRTFNNSRFNKMKLKAYRNYRAKFVRFHRPKSSITDWRKMLKKPTQYRNFLQLAKNFNFPQDNKNLKALYKKGLLLNKVHRIERLIEVARKKQLWSEIRRLRKTYLMPQPKKKIFFLRANLKKKFFKIKRHQVHFRENNYLKILPSQPNFFFKKKVQNRIFAIKRVKIRFLNFKKKVDLKKKLKKRKKKIANKTKKKVLIRRKNSVNKKKKLSNRLGVKLKLLLKKLIIVRTKDIRPKKKKALYRLFLRLTNAKSFNKNRIELKLPSARFLAKLQWNPRISPQIWKKMTKKQKYKHRYIAALLRAKKKVLQRLFILKRNKKMQKNAKKSKKKFTKFNSETYFYKPRGRKTF